MHTVLHAGHADRIVINECKWVCVNKQKRSSRLYRLKSNMKPKGRKQLWAALCWRWQSVPDVSFAKQNVVLSLVRPEGAVKKYFRFEHKSQLCVFECCMVSLFGLWQLKMCLDKPHKLKTHALRSYLKTDRPGAWGPVGLLVCLAFFPPIKNTEQLPWTSVWKALCQIMLQLL